MATKQKGTLRIIRQPGAPAARAATGRENFVRLVNGRMEKVLYALENLEKLGETNGVNATPDDRQAIHDALAEAVARVDSSFERGKKLRFQLTG